jgi:hypothetical protein
MYCAELNTVDFGDDDKDTDGENDKDDNDDRKSNTYTDVGVLPKED